MFDPNKFGAYMSRLRKRADMTQSDLADKLGVSRQAVSKYECGESFPDVTVLVTAAEVLGTTLDDLIGGGEPTRSEGRILAEAASGAEPERIADTQTVADVLGVAPYLKPSVLGRIATSLARDGIDISAVVELAEYLGDETTQKLLETATFDSFDETLMRKLMPFLDDKSKGVIFEKLLSGELDYHFVEIILPYAGYMRQQIEAAVIDGAIDSRVLDLIKPY